MTQRADVLNLVADRIETARCDPITRAAIDGVDGAGKTMFADEIATLLTQKGRTVIRGSVDGFHNPRRLRYRLGRDSPEGYFRDSYDYPALKRLLLDPLSAGGTGLYRLAAFDHATDSTVAAPEEKAEPGAILVFDGIFLHRPELRACWDVSIFLDVDAAVSVARCAARDGTVPTDLASGNRRYIDGQALYIRRCEPTRHATIIIDNNDLDFPFIRRG